MAKFYVETFYRFKKRKTGVCLGMEVEAESDDEAIDFARDQCVGKRWPSRVWVESSCQRLTPKIEAKMA